VKVLAVGGDSESQRIPCECAAPRPPVLDSPLTSVHFDGQARGRRVEPSGANN
jgi:hypothetical protein